MKNISKIILKNLKKTTSVFLALLILLSVSSAAFADNEEKTETALSESQTEVITENDEPDTPEELQIEKNPYSYYLKEELEQNFGCIIEGVLMPAELTGLSIVFLPTVIFLPLTLIASVVIGAGMSIYGLLRIIASPVIALADYQNQTVSILF